MVGSAYAASLGTFATVRVFGFSDSVAVPRMARIGAARARRSVWTLKLEPEEGVET